MNKIMYLEFERCIGCRACQAACRECGDHSSNLIPSHPMHTNRRP